MVLAEKPEQWVGVVRATVYGMLDPYGHPTKWWYAGEPCAGHTVDKMRRLETADHFFCSLCLVAVKRPDPVYLCRNNCGPPQYPHQLNILACATSCCVYVVSAVIVLHTQGWHCAARTHMSGIDNGLAVRPSPSQQLYYRDIISYYTYTAKKYDCDIAKLFSL